MVLCNLQIHTNFISITQVRAHRQILLLLPLPMVRQYDSQTLQIAQEAILAQTF